ncbi:Regulator of chromosome condensation 1/beta-lactamase-inhibitor protein II,Regulator of chromosome [Cinara cedri]|uniref:Regulator of chromosome condensation 1/beta-lactamase-inhibitor protein II,Regulator of chromosome n=1 Tax=Cinara cedri TaxID=506608 RepID=A0A5E4MM85_9HEMI|nr:Regulator of chromosome condensation 1/beta-lactamase-inhibitor protein II,Regulator of chromosome [Cinara cedri]
MMVMYWCGFNGFNQLNSEPFTNLGFHIYGATRNNEEVQQVAFSWSSASVLTSSGEICISGLVNKRLVSCEVLKNTGCDSFKTMSISETNLLATDFNGNCWSYIKSDDKWNDITQLLQKEKQVCQSENHNESSIRNVCCSDTIHLAVTYNEIYSIPSKIYDSKFKVAQVACGFEHILILMETGCLYTQGYGSRGQLGHGELNEEDYPRILKALDGIRIINTSAGGWHSAAITEYNDLYMWGWNHSGQLGISNSPENDGIIMMLEPVLINWPEETDIEQVSLGARHSMVLSKNNVLWGCGWNAHKQLGLETYQLTCDRMINLSNLSPLLKHNVKKIIRVICGAWNSALLLEN